VNPVGDDESYGIGVELWSCVSEVDVITVDATFPVLFATCTAIVDSGGLPQLVESLSNVVSNHAL